VAEAQQADPNIDIVGPTTAFEENARQDVQRFRVVAIVAGALVAAQSLGQLGYVLVTVPQLSSMYVQVAGEVPPPASVLVSAGPWLVIPLLAIDALVFWGFYRLARRYWIGLLFAPIFVVGLITAAIIALLYLPIANIVTLVK